MLTPLLPPTVNMHIVGHCNFRCAYCYARFETAKRFLPLPDARLILAQLRDEGARRITFAGGEPTLHPDVEEMLRACAASGLVTSLVTNGSLERDACRRIFPWLRWLVISCDSSSRRTNDLLGRRAKVDALGQVARVERIVGWAHEWNARRPESERLRLKINMVVTSINAHEDPSEWLARLRPERVKLLQCSIVPGENDDAESLRCADDAFEGYRARLARVAHEGVVVVAERSGELLDSYAMVDPLGRFRQARGDAYVVSAPIAEVGVARAWGEVGGCDMARFRARGGDYDPGAPCSDVRAPIVAIEGLDGSGKSTVARALAARLGASVVKSPPSRTLHERAAADELPASERRDWYWRANREAMKDATDLVFQGTPVVMDRCFASTAAYGAAELGTVATLAEARRDVPRPDLVFLLSIAEGERRRRLRGRGGSPTKEEGRLSHDGAFRNRVLGGYAALGARSVDATGTVDDVVGVIVEQVDAWRRAAP
jgi:radical S-adenosyl methionine domain-containing protein 2